MNGALFQYWDDLSLQEQQELISSISSLDLSVLKKQQLLVKENTQPILSERSLPIDQVNASVSTNAKKKGIEALKAGKAGCLVLAGGQGTRLDFNQPKGTLPFSPIKQKSLFQIISERVVAASTYYKQLFPIAFMVSKETFDFVRTFFASQDNFGLHQEQLFFFHQPNLPILNSQGHLFLTSPSTIAVGPNGNGAAFDSFAQSGILDEWKKRGIDSIQVQMIDNPLPLPLDSEFLGVHLTHEAEITLKLIEKTDPDEKVGVLALEEGFYRVIEYTELNENERIAKTSSGKLKYRYANLSLFYFSLNFIEKMVLEQEKIPLHKSVKKIPFLNEKGALEIPSTPNGWKFESYLFDYLKFAKKTAFLCEPREEIFAPIKNKEGQDSPNTARKLFKQKEIKMFEGLTGEKIEDNISIELSPFFYYPSEELIMKWKEEKSSLFGYLE